MSSWNRRGRSGRGDDDAAAGRVIEEPAAIARRAYATAIKLLGARDHSTAEMTRKLADRDFEPALVDSVLQQLRDANYLNDERYAATYVEQRIERGYGPRAIQNKLRERGIESSLQRDALAAAAPDWTERAHAALAAKFRADQILDQDQKTVARLARFLQSRGFAPGDSIRAIERARASAADA